MPLDLQIHSQRNVLIIRIYGELDHHTASYVRESIELELEKGIYSHLVLNLEGLEFMDSSGLGVILGRYKRIMQMGGKMTLCSVQNSILRLMEMSGLLKILPVYQDEVNAVSACGVAS